MITIGYRQRKRLFLGAAYLVVGVTAAFVLLPFLWSLRTSFMNLNDTLALPLQYIPKRVSFDNYRYIWQNIQYPRWFLKKN